jgi:hypothetical protein
MKRIGLGILLAAILAGPASASIFVFKATLDGASEAPPNASTGTGTAKLLWDDVAQTMSLDMTFSGLTAPTTASHIHAATDEPGAGTAGVATQVPSFVGFPLGVTAGSYSHVFDLTDLATYNPAFVTANGGTAAGAEAALFAALQARKSYLNIHTTEFRGGEIRGFWTAVVPEPAAWALMLAGFAAMGAALRSRRAAGVEGG